MLIPGECLNAYFDKLLTIRTNTLSVRQVLSRHVATNVKLTRPKKPSRCNTLCFGVIMEFMPISKLLVMIRLFRLLTNIGLYSVGPCLDEFSAFFEWCLHFKAMNVIIGIKFMWEYWPISVAIYKTVLWLPVCMAPFANAQADQIQSLSNFYGYPLDFSPTFKRLPIVLMSR